MSCGEIITSNNNGYVKRFAKLNDSKFRRAEKLFLCEGRKLVLESLMYADVKYLLVLNTCRDNFGDIIALAKNRRVEIIYLSESPFYKISTENSPQGVITVVNEPEDTSVVCYDGRIFLADGVRDPGNLGTIIRTAEALGYSRIILSDCADIYSPKSVRASMGGIFRTAVVNAGSMGDVIRSLRSDNRRVFAAALTQSSVKLGSFKLEKNDVFLVGNEGHGLSDELISLCTGTVLIDMRGKAESLNVAAASAIIMWEHSKSFD